MANFTVAKVSSANLNRVPVTNGQVIFVPDAQEIYFDYSDERVLYSHKPQTKTFSEWLNDNTVYSAGTILVCTDRTTKDGVPIPEIKVANGVSNFNELPFINNSNSLEEFGITVDENGTPTFDGKLKHSLTIGDYVFDGTEDVVVPVYKGEKDYS